MPPTKTPRRRPAVNTAVDITPHPSIGNGHAYSHDFREFADFIREHELEGNPNRNAPGSVVRGDWVMGCYDGVWGNGWLFWRTEMDSNPLG